MDKIAFLFAGQGAQYVGMGKELYDNYECSKKIFDKANYATGVDIKKLCFDGPKNELDMTENTQPAVLTTSIAVLAVLTEKGVLPDICAGLSLGEYSALICSGALEFSSAVALVKKRGKYMQEAVPEGEGSMAAIVGLDEKTVREVCSEACDFGVVEPSNFNCPGQIVIAGEIKALDKACIIAKEKGAKKAIPLSVSGPFHTSLLKPAAEKLEIELKKVHINSMKIPIITNVTGDYIKDKEDIIPTLKKQVMSSVMWEHSMMRMINEGVTTFVEIGPGKTLTGFLKKIQRKTGALLNIYNVEDSASVEKCAEELKK